MNKSERRTHASRLLGAAKSGDARSRANPSGERANLQTIANYGEVLTDIAMHLGLTDEDLAADESAERVAGEVDSTVLKIAAWQPDQISEWFDVLATDLEIVIEVNGLDAENLPEPLSLTSANRPSESYASFIKLARSTIEEFGDDLPVTIRFWISKKRALEAIGRILITRPEYLGTPEMLAHTTIAVFYSASAFHRLLGMHALADWERLGLAREDGRAVVVLCDEAGYLAGVALEVLGARTDAEPRWLALSRAGFRQFRQRAAQTRALRDEEGGWAAAPHVLTPAHLRVSSHAPGLDDTAARLDTFQSALAASYLADSVHTAAGNELILRFAGPRPASCRISAKTATGSQAKSATAIAAESATASGSPLLAGEGLGVGSPHIAAESATESHFPARTATAVSPLSSQGAARAEGSDDAGAEQAESGAEGLGVGSPAESATGSLARLCAWAYDNGSPDKLAIARECLARELPHGAEVSLADVTLAATGALDAAKANFTLYLRRNTEQYFAVRQKALDAVADYAATVRKSVSDLTGDVVDNVYRTAGLLVAVVVAALIQPSLSLGVARLASAVYVLYIALLLAFFMHARRRRFELEKSGLEQHLAAMRELGDAERESLRRQPADAETYFSAYFQRAWWIYVGLGAAGLLIFLLLWTPLAPLTGLPHSALPAPTHSLTH